jgi:hypothetical protein
MTIGDETCTPGKRLRNWHRATNSLGELHQMPLRAYARMLARTGDTGEDRARQVVARAWLAGKGLRP